MELEITREPKRVLMVVVMATDPLFESTTDRCEVPWSSGFMDCAYCPPYSVKSWVELSAICCLWHAHTPHNEDTAYLAHHIVKKPERQLTPSRLCSIEQQQWQLTCNSGAYKPCTALHKHKGYKSCCPSVIAIVSPCHTSCQARQSRQCRGNNPRGPLQFQIMVA